MHCTGCTAHCPPAVRQCIAGVPVPTTPRQRGSALQEFHCPLPPGSVAVRCKSSTTHCPQAVWQCTAGIALPSAPRGEAMREMSSTTHCPRAVRQCIAGGPVFRQRPPHGQDSPSPPGRCMTGVPLPTAPRQCGRALQELHSPLPLGSGAVQCRSCTAHCPQAVWQSIAGVPLFTAATASWAGLPVPPACGPAHCRISTGHRLQAV